ncbi:hypothetical protein HaLaN_09104 [Haematococcus lacustris]|uniref:Uncharacterized protein n=1 Tax=Haematococcus lacustris TaxID=44745 RepID=A0A699YTW5_HAELA|nr:hypothetical protein HaLaN_09104 [Haematococcus lacustris]
MLWLGWPHATTGHTGTWIGNVEWDAEEVLPGAVLLVWHGVIFATAKGSLWAPVHLPAHLPTCLPARSCSGMPPTGPRGAEQARGPPPAFAHPEQPEAQPGQRSPPPDYAQPPPGQVARNHTAPYGFTGPEREVGQREG